jgi:uncharacterized iron-regulated protein
MNKRNYRSLSSEIKKAHCGHVPKKRMNAMVNSQRYRDFVLARQIESAMGEGRVFVIAGNAHVRTDRGAPAYLRRIPRNRVVSVGLIEAPIGATSVEESLYAKAPNAWTLVRYTRRLDQQDPCVKFKKALSKMKKK